MRSILCKVSPPCRPEKCVANALAVLKDEMESVMRLIGIKDLSEVHPGLVNTFDVDHLVPATPDHPYAKWRPKPRLQSKL